MSAPFQPGDVVECVRCEVCNPDGTYDGWAPTVGAYYRVAAAWESKWYPGEFNVDLDEDPEPEPEWGFPAEWFVKPAADEQFTAEMRALKPTVAPRLNPARHSVVIISHAIDARRGGL